jgi:hypothetical protein
MDIIAIGVLVLVVVVGIWAGRNGDSGSHNGSHGPGPYA